MQNSDIWSEQQADFGLSLTKPDNPVPELISKTPDLQPSLKRFNVYRNNSIVALTESLMSGFPVVSQLVGEEFFRAMASVYIRQTPPASPVLIHYGESLPDFIDSFEPAQSVPYLSAIARLEWAWTQSYNAANATPILIDHLGAIPPEQIGSAKLTLHPSLYLLNSDWPAFSIWSAHQQENPAELMSGIESAAESGFLVRPDLNVEIIVVLSEVYTFIKYIAEGNSLEDSFSQIEGFDQEDLSGCLQLLFNSGAVIGIQ